MKEVVRNARDLGVAERFVLRGSIPASELHDLQWDTDIMVHNAIVAPDGGRECLGVALIEAGALGIPVVSCKVGGIPEVIVDDVTGFLVESGDLPGMAEKVMRLCRDAELRLTIGLAALAHTRRAFDSKLLAQRLESVYDAQLAS